MGTVVTMDLYLLEDYDRDTVQLRIDRAVADLHEVDNVFSTWQPTSAISRVRCGALDLAAAPAVLIEVLAACASIREASWGWFDPWAMPGGVDPSGYVKGWAAQRAAMLLDGPATSGVLVNAAGDVFVLGAPTTATSFRVGVVNPFSPNTLALVVEVDAAVATSGTYERGDHLIDPGSGAPRADVASATVTGPDAGVADALATALAVGGTSVLPAIDELDNYEGLTIGHDGVVAHTPGFPLAGRPPRDQGSRTL